eukprot:gene18703-19004_t
MIVLVLDRAMLESAALWKGSLEGLGGALAMEKIFWHKEVPTSQSKVDPKSNHELLHTHAKDERTVELDGNVYSAAEIHSSYFIRLLSVLAVDHRVSRIALSRPLRTLNKNARSITQSGSVGYEPFSAAGLNGTNTIVGLSDTGIDESSCFFRDAVHGKVPQSNAINVLVDSKYRKIVQYVNYSGSGGDYKNGHGSHVAGTLAGYCMYQSPADNANYNEYRGIASGAKIAFFDIGVNDSAEDLLLPYELGDYLYPIAYAAGARVHSNSWGGGYWYDAYCMETDTYLFENQDFTIFFAGGNDGSTGIETVLSPALAKNAVAVGCTDNGNANGQRIDNIASFSSHGPSPDGRLKPDILAPGFSLYSVAARSENSAGESCGLEWKAGTSMSTPVAAASALLIRLTFFLQILQYFMDKNFWAAYCDRKHAICRSGGFSPSGVLVKAVLLHSGQQVSLYNSAIPLGNTPDDYQGYGRVDLLNVLPLASSPFSLFVYYGNTPVSGNRPAMGSKRDELNNNEQVHIAAPIPGVWQVAVQAKLLSESPFQNYSLVITTSGSVAQMEVNVALYSRVVGGGWGTKDSYIILANRSDDLASLGSFPQSAPTVQLKDDFACLSAGCYVAKLQLEGGSASVRGSSLGIPESFCVTPPIEYTANTTNIAPEAFEGSCVASCLAKDHVLVPLLPFEYQGGGWNDAYYFIRPISSFIARDSSSSSSSSLLESVSMQSEAGQNGFASVLVADTLQSGFDDFREYLADDAIEFPQIFFPDEKVIHRSAGKKPLDFVDDPISLLDLTCPFQVNISFPIAKICIADEADSDNSYVTFFSKIGYNATNYADFGQLPETVADLQNMQSLEAVSAAALREGLLAGGALLLRGWKSHQLSIASILSANNPTTSQPSSSTSDGKKSASFQSAVIVITVFIVILLLLAFVQWYRSRSASTTEESRSGQAAPYDESSVHSMTPSMIEELRFSLPAPLTRWLGLASPPSDYKQ